MVKLRAKTEAYAVLRCECFCLCIVIISEIIIMLSERIAIILQFVKNYYYVTNADISFMAFEFEKYDK